MKFLLRKTSISCGKIKPLNDDRLYQDYYNKFKKDKRWFIDLNTLKELDDFIDYIYNIDEFKDYIGGILIYKRGDCDFKIIEIYDYYLE